MSEWIDRSVRLPKERGTYLVCRSRIGSIEIVNYGTSKGFENGRDKLHPYDSPYRITHWMPLPPLPDQAPGGGHVHD